MSVEGNLNYIRDLVANGKIGKAFEELKKIANEIDDKQLRNSILLNCFSYNTNYDAEMLNLQNNSTGINRAVLKTLEFIDEIEEQLGNDKGIPAKGKIEVLYSEELPIELEKKIDIIVEKYFFEIIIERGDLNRSLTQNAISLKQFDVVLKKVKTHFEFFKKEFANSSGMTLSNFANYAIDAIYIPENEWQGSGNRKRITRDFRELLKK